MPSVVRIHLRPHDIAEVAQLIEHQPSKLRVASLSLVFRSKNLESPFRGFFVSVRFLHFPTKSWLPYRCRVSNKFVDLYPETRKQPYNVTGYQIKPC